ncbi:major facilitator superfamily domain-containing protein [Aspergillus bertholletiae]|uniref:Major facilitator superfamily domain-containing protein n=1 Tax=Aspergillus bertholletiae TaxID=1226010 RepID=A0A5N7BB50_9EURO|nr:major facilitator superfamily domain-containing protein [Aspergillus bertholletiae]
MNGRDCRGNGKDIPVDETPEAQTKASVHDTASIPDGGIKAWMQVVGTFFMFFNTWGVLNTFGSYQTYYETQKLFASSSSNISWIGSVQSSLLLVLGLITGPLYDAGYFYPLLFSGSFMIVLGQMMLSLSKEYYQVLLSQGFCIGIGAGLILIPGIAILSTYFSTNLALANGVAATGSGLGGILYPIIFHRLLDRIGFGWTCRAIGLVIFVTIAIPITVFRLRVKPSGKRKLLELEAFREPAYTFFVLGCTLEFISLNIPFYYIQYYAIREGIATTDLGFYLLSILTTGSVFGRILPNIFANVVGPFNIMVVCTVMSGVMMFALVNLSSLAGVVIVAVLYGFFTGAFVSLPPTCYVKLSPDRALIGTRMGMGYAVITIGNLVGAPVAGAILQHRGFNAVWIFGGGVSMVGGITMLISRNCQGGWKRPIRR